MNEYMQFSAKNKNEAITKACIELGVSSDQLDIQVISEGSSGFFGIGSKLMSHEKQEEFVAKWQKRMSDIEFLLSEQND